MRRGRGRPFAIEQTKAVSRAVNASFDVALAEARSAFRRLRDSNESAALRHLFFAERQAKRFEELDRLPPLQVHSIGIVGAGTMGAGIAAAFLAAGYPVNRNVARMSLLLAGMPNGGAIALGHPLGMSGARIVGTAALELALDGGRYALAKMCIGVGQGIAIALEKV